MTDDEPTKNFLPTMSGLSQCYEVSETALAKMAKKYNFSRFDLAGPDEVYEKLVRIGDRRGAMVRRLSDPEIRTAIWEEIMGLKWEEQP